MKLLCNTKVIYKLGLFFNPVFYIKIMNISKFELIYSEVKLEETFYRIYSKENNCNT